LLAVVQKREEGEERMRARDLERETSPIMFG
jgi:hypothetical protein